jgi:hypothetical protein
MEDKLKVIETIGKILGTAVEIPQYTSDPNNIGMKLYAGAVRTPLLEGVDRKEVLDLLLIKIKEL